MAEEDYNRETARARLLELLEGDDCEWEFSERAEREGRIVLRWLHKRMPTRWEMVEYVISLLKANTPLQCAPQGDPPGSTGIAWQMTASRNVFVKLRICEQGLSEVRVGGLKFGQEYAFIQSIHESIHPQ